MSFFHEINVTELRDGITSLHGMHEKHQTCSDHRVITRQDCGNCGGRKKILHDAKKILGCCQDEYV